MHVVMYQTWAASVCMCAQAVGGRLREGREGGPAGFAVTPIHACKAVTVKPARPPFPYLPSLPPSRARTHTYRIIGCIHAYFEI